MAAEKRREDINDSNDKDIWKYIFGYTRVAVVKCAIELGIPDILEKHKSPISLADLASEIGCSSHSSLYRVMKLLVHYKVFQEKTISENKSTCVGFVQTSLSRQLTRDGKGSLADFLLLTSSPAMIDPLHKLSGWVLGNKEIPFEAAHGKDLWEFCKANPGHGKLFNDGMASESRMLVAIVLEDCPELFEGLKTVVDVGGGDGTALRLIVEACPWIKGINLDLPHMVALAPLVRGVEHVGGNMFDHVPKADAAYLMKVLHNWDDDQCVAILKNCRKAISDTGKIIIVDVIVGREDDDELEGVGLILDIVMMALSSRGKERTLKEWGSVIHEAGFSRYTTKHNRSPYCVIEVYP